MFGNYGLFTLHEGKKTLIIVCVLTRSSCQIWCRFSNIQVSLRMLINLNISFTFHHCPKCTCSCPVFYVTLYTDIYSFDRSFHPQQLLTELSRWRLMALLKYTTVLPSGTTEKCLPYHLKFLNQNADTDICGCESKRAKLGILFGCQIWHTLSNLSIKTTLANHGCLSWCMQKRAGFPLSCLTVSCGIAWAAAVFNSLHVS